MHKQSKNIKLCLYYLTAEKSIQQLDRQLTWVWFTLTCGIPATVGIILEG